MARPLNWAPVSKTIVMERALLKLDQGSENLYWRLLLFADDGGRFSGDPVVIRSQCYPCDGLITIEEIARRMRALEACALVAHYALDDESVVCAVKNVQRFHRFSRGRFSWPSHPETRTWRRRNMPVQNELALDGPENNVVCTTAENYVPILCSKRAVKEVYTKRNQYNNDTENDTEKRRKRRRGRAASGSGSVSEPGGMAKVVNLTLKGDHQEAAREFGRCILGVLKPGATIEADSDAVGLALMLRGRAPTDRDWIGKLREAWALAMTKKTANVGYGGWRTAVVRLHGDWAMPGKDDHGKR